MRKELGLNELKNEVSLAKVRNMMQPALVTSSSSVSGKLFVAAELEKLDTIGIDVVASALNDLYVRNARALSFNDNITCAKPKSDKIREIERGIAEGCRLGDVNYVGSQIKDLPDIFSYDQYDLVGFATGIIEKQTEQAKRPLADGDVIIGLPSEGLHNNGYVVARKKLYLSKASMEIYYESLGATLGELLLQPTKLYKNALEAIYASQIPIKACVQVAQGGLDYAVHRLTDNQAGAVIKLRADTMPMMYDMLHKDGNISDEVMRQTFNMGIGVLLVVSEEDADSIAEVLDNVSEESEYIGLIEKDASGIRYLKG